MGYRESAKENITALVLNDGRTFGLSAGDYIRIYPLRGYRGNGLVLSVSTKAETVRRLLLSALPDCTVFVEGIGEFKRSDVKSVYDYKGRKE